MISKLYGTLVHGSLEWLFKFCAKLRNDSILTNPKSIPNNKYEGLISISQDTIDPPGSQTQFGSQNVLKTLFLVTTHSHPKCRDKSEI